MTELLSAVEEMGYTLHDTVLSLEQLGRLRLAVGRLADDSGAYHRGGVYAARGLLERLPEVAELARSVEARALVAPVLGEGWRPVRAIYFDKTPAANWKVPWHQDLTIAVKKRCEAPGYGPWSVKDGVAHVQPPMEVLERMVSVRFALDENDLENGPLRVLPGTHRFGRLAAADIARLRAEIKETVCCVPEGGALLFRPLLLHASSPMVSGTSRRVIHIEYAAGDLSHGLEWVS